MDKVRESIYIVLNNTVTSGYWFEDEEEAEFKADFMNQTLSLKDDRFIAYEIKLGEYK